MIFFSIPSVGQIKHKTAFGHDDHFGFIQTLIGSEYIRSDVRNKCKEYYDKPTLKYWDQIITLINFMGFKKLDEKGRFSPIPLLNFIADQYDQDINLPSKILFDYLLCKWQYPHPLLTHDRSLTDTNLGITINNQRSEYSTVKPYAVILSILKHLFLNNPKSAYLTDDEFYWLGYNFYEKKGGDFTLNNAKEIAKNILSLRKNGGWDMYNKLRDLPQTSTHLSYPKGFLKNSSVLTADGLFYDISDDFFIGLKTFSNIIAEVDSLINSSEETFDFDRSLSQRNNKLGYEYSEYLYNPNHINKWLNSVKIYKNQANIFKTVDISKDRFDELKYEKFKVNTQLKRLSVLDKATVTRRRTEQYILRDYLLKNKSSGICAICNNSYPIKFLATAHIKKRAYCNDNEKRDLNVVMPACHLGCDKIYEFGYVVVKDGLIKGNLSSKVVTKDLVNYIDKIKDKKCSFYKEETKKYFKHHENKFIKN